MAQSQVTTEEIVGIGREGEIGLSQAQNVGLYLSGVWDLGTDLLRLAARARRSEA